MRCRRESKLWGRTALTSTVIDTRLLQVMVRIVALGRIPCRLQRVASRVLDLRESTSVGDSLTALSNKFEHDHTRSRDSGTDAHNMCCRTTNAWKHGGRFWPVCSIASERSQKIRLIERAPDTKGDKRVLFKILGCIYRSGWSHLDQHSIKGESTKDRC